MEDNAPAPRRVGILLIIGIVFLPFIFAWFTLRRGYSTTARAVSFGWLAVAVGITAFEPQEWREQRAARAAAVQERAAAKQAAEDSAAQAKKQADQKTGLHCLSKWDGSSRSFKKAIVAQLRDPDSFEHIETRITPRNAKNEHGVVMSYRARNGFGGMNVGTAIGAVDSTTCEVTRLNELGD